MTLDTSKRPYITKADIEKNPYIEFHNLNQGYGYKVEDLAWDSISSDTVIYIPEFGIARDDEEREYAKVYYTKQDFIDLCADEDCPVDAVTLFDMVDWQFPESLLDELS